MSKASPKPAERHNSHLFGQLSHRNGRKADVRQLNHIEMHQRKDVPVTLPRISILEREDL